MNHSAQDVCKDIDPSDEMYLTALTMMKNDRLARALYFRQGAEIDGTVQQLLNWKFGAQRNNLRFLDFACGYGRFTRFLVTSMPPSSIWVSDIYREAVAFQKKTFGVNGFDSCLNPRDLECTERFDVIFVASLFTHLPATRFRDWLHVLFNLLTPTGILVFSVHDQSMASGQTIPESGLLFLHASESRTLSTDDYGSTYVTEDFVRSMIFASIADQWRYKRLVRALCGAHDIYVVSRDSGESFESLSYRQSPVGYVDWFTVSDAGELRIGGWAGEPNIGIELKLVRVRIGNEAVVECVPHLVREDVARVLGNPKFSNSGWECVYTIDRDRLRGDEVIEVRAISESGLSTVFHVGPISDGYHPKALSGGSVLSTWRSKVSRIFAGKK